MEKGMTEGNVGELTNMDAESTSQGENSEFYTPVLSSPSATPSSSCSAYQSSRIDKLRESRSEYESAVEFEIAASTSHWTQLDSDSDSDEYSDENSDEDSDSDTECSPKEHLKHFKSRCEDDCWDYDQFFFDTHHLVVGKKIAEEGQAEIYEAQVDGDPKVVGSAQPLVVKVFKEGFSLQSLQRKWSPEMEREWKFRKGTSSSRLDSPFSWFEGTILLNEKRFHNKFALVMSRAWGDLRKHIDLRMLNRKHKQAPPYSTREAVILMIGIAWGMSWLHDSNILHQDLKASNVLLKRHTILGQSIDFRNARVTDFECSVGVVGTRFWRAPEILQQLQDGVSTSKVMFTKKADVYSFGMTCYEIVIGCIPFEDVSWQNYNHVLSGNQPILPLNLDPSIRDMIISCWQLNPLKRPSFDNIYKTLLMPSLWENIPHCF